MNATDWTGHQCSSGSSACQQLVAAWGAHYDERQYLGMVASPSGGNGNGNTGLLKWLITSGIAGSDNILLIEAADRLIVNQRQPVRRQGRYPANLVRMI